MNAANAVISVVFLAAWALACWEAWREAGRIARDERAEQALRGALKAHAEDMTHLVDVLPPEQVAAAVLEWEKRQ